VKATTSGEIGYLHSVQLRGREADHLPVPVALAELADPVMECDFCSQAGPAWSYLCGRQRTEMRVVTARVMSHSDYRDHHHAGRARRVETADAPTQDLGRRWAACDGCAALIEARDLLGLIGRVTERMPAPLTRSTGRLIRIRGEMRALYEDIFATLQPGRQPLPAVPSTDPAGSTSGEGS
jgi:hypothetical protein